MFNRHIVQRIVILLTDSGSDSVTNFATATATDADSFSLCFFFFFLFVFFLFSKRFDYRLHGVEMAVLLIRMFC